MNGKIAIVPLILMLALSFVGCNNKTSEKDTGSDAASLLTQVKTTQYFTDNDISDNDIEKIISAGINAPSAMNTQPWHFTAITDEETTQIIADAMESMKPPTADENKSEQKNDKKNFLKSASKAGIGDAPLTVVISCEDGSELSAGLATQNMSAEAQLLGYGTKILTSPTIVLNGENSAVYKELLGIPDNQRVAAVLIVGEAEENTEDAMSGATSRNGFNDMVTMIK